MRSDRVRGMLGRRKGRGSAYRGFSSKIIVFSQMKKSEPQGKYTAVVSPVFFFY